MAMTMTMTMTMTMMITMTYLDIYRHEVGMFVSIPHQDLLVVSYCRGIEGTRYILLKLKLERVGEIGVERSTWTRLAQGVDQHVSHRRCSPHHTSATNRSSRYEHVIRR